LTRRPRGRLLLSTKKVMADETQIFVKEQEKNNHFSF